MSFIRKYFKKDNVIKLNVEAYDINDFDETFKIIMRILGWVKLRLFKKDSVAKTYVYTVVFWIEFFNIMGASTLLALKMIETGKGGSFVDFVNVFKMMPLFGFMAVALAKVYQMFTYRDLYQDMMDELRNMWPQREVTKEEDKIIGTALKQLHRVIQSYYWCNVVMVLSFVVPGICGVIARTFGYNIPRVLPFLYWLPFDPLQPYVFELFLGLQSWYSVLADGCTVCGDLLFCVFTTHITIQFDLLAIRVRKLINVPIDPQLVKEYPLGLTSEEVELNDNLDNIHQKEVRDIIKRHCDLLRLSANLEKIFSFSLFVNFLNGTVIICFSGFCCMVEKISEVSYKLFLVLALSQLWLLCWYGQKLMDSSEAISHALYNCGWYMASKSIKSTVIFMLQRAQKAVRVTTYGFSIICLQSYTTIIKTSWSYFTLLLNVYKQ